MERDLPVVHDNQHLVMKNLPWRQDDPAPYYARLVKKDVMTLLQPLVDEHGFRNRFGDGKLEGKFALAGNPPWHYVELDYQNDCWMQQSVLFQIVSRQTNRRFTPSYCLQCWKIVCQGAPGHPTKPMNLPGLFALVEVQKALGKPAKCGIEVRHYTPAQYGGYWYTHSLAEGLERYEEVRKAVDEHPDLGPKTSVILKRGCSEFELAVGWSANYKATDDQLELEADIKRAIHSDPNIHPQPQSIINRVHRRWIDHACAIGDETYKQYTGGLPIFPEFATYHHLLPHLKKGWRPTGEFQDGLAVLERMPMPVQVKKLKGGWYEVSDELGGFAKVRGKEKAEALADKMSAGGQRIVVGGPDDRQDDATKTATVPPTLRAGAHDEGTGQRRPQPGHAPPMFLREHSEGGGEPPGEGAAAP